MTQVSELTGSVVGDGKYALRGRLGAGAFGTVYRADELLNGSVVRQVALKLYSPEASRTGNVEGMLSDCALPARILSSDAPLDVKRHFAQIFDFGYLDTDAGRCAFVAMELIRGAETLEDLSDRYHDVGRFPKADQVLDYARQFFTALAAAHGAGVLHRDIKGANVMVDNGVVRVMDFGMGADLSQPDAPLKTTMSIYAPENFDGRYTAASDIYQAGLMFYEFYTGIAPFVDHGIAAHQQTDMNRERLKRVDFRYRPGKSIPGCHYDDLLDAVLGRCLEYSDFKRYGSAEEVLAALSQADTAATAAQAEQQGDHGLARQLAGQALANPDTPPDKRIQALATLAAAHAAGGNLDDALDCYKQAIAEAETSGALFHLPSDFNALVDGAVAIYTSRGQAGLARLLSKKRR